MSNNIFIDTLGYGNMVELTVFVSQIHFTMTQKASPWLRTTTQLNSNRLVLVQTKQSQAMQASQASCISDRGPSPSSRIYYLKVR